MPTEFMECEACKAKPGTPLLCNACLNSRHTFLKYERLRLHVVHLQSIVNKLPKDADGVPMIYGDPVWWWEDETVQEGIWRGIGCDGPQVEKRGRFLCWPLIEWLHSTREAAKETKPKGTP